MEPGVPYDELADEEQVSRRDEWSTLISERIAELDMAEELRCTAYAELDDEGYVVVRHPDGTSERATKVPVAAPPI